MSVQLQQCLGSWPRTKSDYVVGEGFTNETYEFPYEEKILKQALLIIEQMNRTPETDKEFGYLGQEITALTYKTKSRNGTQDDLTLKMGSYVEALRGYPLDLVVKALREWPKTENGRWWPTEGELHQMIDPEAKERRAMLRDIKKKIDNLSAPKIQSKYSAVDQEAKDDDERRKTGLLMKLHRLGYFNKQEMPEIRKFKDEFMTQDYDICANMVSKYEQSIFEVTL